MNTISNHKPALMAALVTFAMTVSTPATVLYAQQSPTEENSNIEVTPTTITPIDKRSDSPWLRLQPEMRNIPDAVVPPTKADLQGTAISLTTVSFDAQKRTETRANIPMNAESEQEKQRALPSFTGLLLSHGTAEAGPAMESIIGSDDRSRVSTTTNFPWRTIVKLIVTFPNKQTFDCSGAIIGPFHVLTAGHCIHSVDNGGWYSETQVIAGLDNTYMPYRLAKAINAHSYTGWTDHQQTEHDWAVLVLDRNLGNFTGWMGRQTADPGHAIYKGNLNTAGYPGDLCSSNCMYFDADTGHSANTDNHWYRMDTMPGQSGSPVWRLDGNERYILTVHTSGVDSTGANHGTRLHQDKYDRLIGWMNADTPPVDYADLIDDGPAYSGFNLTTLKQSASGFVIWNDVRNIGTAASGNFKVSYYASRDSIITTDDYLIGATNVTSLQPFSWTRAEWRGTFPSSIIPGTYHIGWIVDSTGSVVEFDDGNNTATQPSIQLTVLPNRVLLPMVSTNLVPIK